MSNIDAFEEQLKDLGVPTGMDVERFKQKIIEKKNENSDTRFLKLPYGKTVIRILPPYNKNRIGQYSEEYLQHKMGDNYIVCSRKSGESIKKCPICMLATNFYNSQDKNENQISKMIYAHKRYYLNVVVKEYVDVDWEKSRMEEPKKEEWENKVFILDAPVSIVKIIEKFIIENGDVTNVLSGKDFVINKKNKTYDNGSVFVTYEESQFKTEPSYLANSPELIKAILSSQYDLEKILQDKRKNFNELTNFAMGHFNDIGNFRVSETLKQLISGEPVIHTKQYAGQQVNTTGNVKGTVTQTQTQNTSSSSNQQQGPQATELEDDLSFDEFTNEMEDEIDNL